MKRNKKTVISQLMVIVLLVCGLLTGCGSEPGPEQGDEKVPNLPKESVLPTVDSQPADIASGAEPFEAPTYFSNKPVVEEADILCSGKYQELDWLVSRDGLLVVTGIWEKGNKWDDMWVEIQASIEDDTVMAFLIEHPIFRDNANFVMARGEEFTPAMKLFITDAYVDVRNVTSLDDVFEDCGNLESVDLSNLDTSNVRSMYNMFYRCYHLDNLDLSSFDTSNVTNMGYMFYNCVSLTNLNISNWDTGKLESTGWMFDGCTKLTSLDLSSWNTECLNHTVYMFQSCSSLENLDLSNWNIEVDTAVYMFSGCESLSTLDLSGFDTKQVREGGLGMMFAYCSNLTAIYVGAGWSDDAASNMFEGCGVDHVTVKE